MFKLAVRRPRLPFTIPAADDLCSYKWRDVLASKTYMNFLESTFLSSPRLALPCIWMDTISVVSFGTIPDAFTKGCCRLPYLCLLLMVQDKPGQPLPCLCPARCGSSHQWTPAQHLLGLCSSSLQAFSCARMPHAAPQTFDTKWCSLGLAPGKELWASLPSGLHSTASSFHATLKRLLCGAQKGRWKVPQKSKTLLPLPGKDGIVLIAAFILSHKSNV